MECINVSVAVTGVSDPFSYPIPIYDMLIWCDSLLALFIAYPLVHFFVSNERDSSISRNMRYVLFSLNYLPTPLPSSRPTQLG